MDRFDRQIAIAKRLIALNGQSVVWRSLRDEPDHPVQPWKRVPSPPVDHNVAIVFLPIDRIKNETLRALADSEVAVGSVYGLMGEVPFDLSLKDIVIRDGVELRVTAIDTLSPNGQKILHTVYFDA